MSGFIDFITHSSQEIQVLLFTGTIFIGWNIENIAGLGFDYKKWPHAFSNMPFIVTNFPIQILLGVAFIKTIAWTGLHHFGLLYYLPLLRHPQILFLASFILLDLGEYIYHVIMHRVKRLWMFHVVHHSDPVVDVSTTLREHPGENFVRMNFTLLWLFLSGSLLWVFLLRQTIQVISTLFAHMNYRLPKKTDRLIGMLFITPNLHHVHHHYRQPFTDRNYGDVLSIWDRMFGTFQKLPDEPVVFGIDTHMSPEDIGKFKSVFRIPFGKYRKRAY